MIDPLTLDQLRVLVAVVEAGSFSAAARKLGRVQSAVSQSIQTLETALGVRLFDRSTKTPGLTEAGAALVVDARAIIEQARILRARAQSLAEDIEPELTLAVDPIFPMPLLMESLAALRQAYPQLPATLFTEGLGGAEESLRDGSVRMAIFTAGPSPDLGLAREFLLNVALAPVVASDHPLAREAAPVPLETLARHVQLVLTGKNANAQALRGGIISRQLWRFADLSTRLEFLLAGFGWCNMPTHLVSGPIAQGRLKRLEIAGETPPVFRLYVGCQRGREFGKAGRWLIADLRRRIAQSEGAYSGGAGVDVATDPRSAE